MRNPLPLPFDHLQKLVKNKYFLYAIRLMLGLALSLVIVQINLDKFEFPLYDLRLKYKPIQQNTNQIVLVSINQKTVSELKHIPTASEHRLVIANLQKMNPQFILYSMSIKDIKGPPTDLHKLAKELSSKSNVYVISNELEMKGEESSKVSLAAPFNHVQVLSGPLTKDAKTFAKDGVTRRAMIKYQDQLMLHPLLAGALTPELKSSQNIKGLFTYFDSEQIYINYTQKRDFKTIPFENLLSGTADNLSNKIIIIGTDLLATFDEYTQTPISEGPTSMTVMEQHAQIFETLFQNSGIIQAPPWLNLLFVILISIWIIEVVLGMKPLRGLIILLSTFAGFTTIACLIFWFAGIWINMIQVYMSIFLTYYFFIPYRLIKENRKSWEYFQKHKLLTQVEELKTNFISMMSHDLKTPIARILGMTEVIMKEATVMKMDLSLQQREALDTIKSSSEDLLKFINSILQYGKIESQGIELNLQSKDINTLIEDVIKKHEFLAKLKQIQVHKNLEPLFPIQVDPELIKQVLSNLIENAIKYSHEKTIIQVNSLEKNDSVLIQVIDHGPGIPAEELPHVFMKFFRSRNAKSSSIKGSGLGLYLAKYFTELHQGQITVESTEGQGSTFTVVLPLAQPK